MKLGDSCLCSPIRFDKQEEEIVVRIHPGKTEARCPFAEAFSSARAPYTVYATSLCTRNHDDIVEINRTFAAEVISLKPLVVSRRKRLAALWKELAAAAGLPQLYLAQIERQRSGDYRLVLEGNLVCWANKSPLEDYLSDRGYKGFELRRMMPQEGDTVVLSVVSVNAPNNQLTVDMVSPLQRLDQQGLTDEILRILDSPTKAAAVAPYSTSSGSLALKSDLDIPKLEPHNVVLVVDDDELFGAFLAQELVLLGAKASYCAPAQILATIATSAFTHLLVDVDMDQVGFGQVMQTIKQQNISPQTIVIAMSALGQHETLSSDSSLTLEEALAHYAPQIPFWPKLLGGLHHSLRMLADIIGESTDQHFDIESLSKPAPAKPPHHNEASESEIEDTLRHTASKLQLLVEADTACVFLFDISSWRVSVFSPDPAVEARAQDADAQAYLPYSPIRDISYMSEDALVCEDIYEHRSSYWNILRLFNPHHIADQVEQIPFHSLLGYRLHGGASRRYSVFFFWKSHRLRLRSDILPKVRAASPNLETRLLIDLYRRQTTMNQPFYLDGLARTGQWHDARRLIINITSILTPIAQAQDKAGPIQSVVKTVQAAVHTCEEVNQLIARRLFHYVPQQSPAPYDITSVVTSSIATAKSVGSALNHTPSRCIQIFQHPSLDENLHLEGFEYDLRRVLENLLVNAVEHGLLFSRPIVAIRVFLQQRTGDSPGVDLYVVDNGPGIRGLHLIHMFEPLFSTKAHGFGMGLAICKNICQKRGMTIAIRQTALFAGTCFHLGIPVCMAQNPDDYNNA